MTMIGTDIDKGINMKFIGNRLDELIKTHIGLYSVWYLKRLRYIDCDDWLEFAFQI